MNPKTRPENVMAYFYVNAIWLLPRFPFTVEPSFSDLLFTQTLERRQRILWPKP
jgi:hypothetical protein